MEATTASSDGNSAAVSAGPTTFAEAFASDASSASDTSQQSTTTPAAVQPGAAGEQTPQQADERSPFIPRDRFDEVNTKKAELESKLQTLAWAEQVQQQDFTQIQKIARHFQSGDKVSGLRELVAELSKEDAAFAAQLRSEAARTLAQRQQPAAAPDLNPIQVQLENGQTVGLYSAEQIAALKGQWLGEVEQKFEPLVKTHEQMQADRAAAQQQQKVDHFVTTTYADVQTWPGMQDKANQVAVANALAAARVESDDPREVSLALNAAYRQVVLPKLSHSSETALLDNLKTKAAAANRINPGSAAASTPRAVTSFSDPSLKWK